MRDVNLVSIIVAAYNVESYLKRCVDSLLQQTEKSIEIILVNDGSTDSTSQIVDKFAERDSRVVPIHRQNGGLSIARNTGLEVASSEYVCFVDGDDWVEPDLVESMVQAISTTEAQVVIAGAYVDVHNRDDEVKSTTPRVPPAFIVEKGTPVPSDLVDHNLINLLGYAWNKLYEREWLQELNVEFEEGLSLIEDIVFNSQVLCSAQRVSFVNKAFVHYIQRPRKTLGTTHDETYLSKCFRAIGCQDAVLETWGLNELSRDKRKSLASGTALWAALRSASTHPQPVAKLRDMVNFPGTEELLQNTHNPSLKEWRIIWVNITLRKHRFKLALLPFRLSSN